MGAARPLPQETSTRLRSQALLGAYYLYFGWEAAQRPVNRRRRQRWVACHRVLKRLKIQKSTGTGRVQ